MSDEFRKRLPAHDRARKRAIRAAAAKAGVPYSVARHWLAPDQGSPVTIPASQGRTVYPQGSDSARQQAIESRNRRSFEQRRQDTRLAADLPLGRARHLVERFPPTRGEAQTAVGLLYHGNGRQEVLALLYAMVSDREPELVPSVGDLAWVAELGEETAVDTACARLDRAARLLLDRGAAGIAQSVEQLLAEPGPAGADQRVLAETWYLTKAMLRMANPNDRDDSTTTIPRLPLDGVGHILDALLIIAEDGHAPGTRVRILPAPAGGALGTIVSVRWGSDGPPVSYEVRPDRSARSVSADPEDLIVLGAGTQPLGIVEATADTAATHS